MYFLFSSPQSYAQRKLITSFSNQNDWKLQGIKKTNIVSYMQKRSKNGKVNIFQFDSTVLKDSTFFLDVFSDNSLKIIKDEIEKRSENDFSLYAHIQGAAAKEGSLVLIYLNGEVSGNLNYKFKNYAIHPLGKGQFAIYEIDFKNFPQDDAPGKPNNDNNSNHNFIPGSLEKSTLVVAAPICPIRVLVAYTTNAEANIKNSLGYTAMTQFINQAIAETNQSYLNSNVNFRVQLAAAVRVGYTESGDYDTDLGRFRTPGDGFMDEVHTYRDLYSADVCVLIFNNNAYCGLADAIQASASTAFCEVHYECVLGNYSFAHEIAHLFGCRHNTEVDNSTSPFAYGHGFVYTAGGWRTVMAYNLSGETRLQYFSNPNIYYNGIAMGTSNINNNARVLNETAGTVGAFRGTFFSLALSSSGSVINDEAADATSTSSIILQPGFQVTNNSVFHAYIKNCTDLASLQDNYVVNSKEENAALEEDTRSGNASLSIYPNPSSGMVRIKSNDPGLENAKIVINDQFGREVYKLNNNSGNSVKLNLNYLISGIYYININMPDKKISKKLIIVK